MIDDIRRAAISKPRRRRHPERLLTFLSGGWVLGLAGLLCVLAVVVRIPEFSGNPNRFSLANSLVPAEQVHLSFRIDALPPLQEPLGVPVSLEWLADQPARAKRLVTTDRVVGVCLNGEAKAYPLRFMNWHELANDTVGGAPILVTFGGVADAAAVYSRRVGGEVLEFGHSGLLCHSSLLFYDRTEPGNGNVDASSLWSQVQGRALTGPRRGHRLEYLPCALTTLGAWLEEYPNTTVILGSRELEKNHYRSTAYSRLYKRRQIPGPPPEIRDPHADPEREFESVITVRPSGSEAFTLFERDLAALDSGSTTAEPHWRSLERNGLEFAFLYVGARTPIDPPTIWVMQVTGGKRVPVPASYARYYAWYAADQAMRFN